MGAWSEGMEWVHGVMVVSSSTMVVALVLFNKEVVSSVLL